jgi:hypothetical protein
MIDSMIGQDTTASRKTSRRNPPTRQGRADGGDESSGGGGQYVPGVRLVQVEVFDDPLAIDAAGQDDGDGDEHPVQPSACGRDVWDQADGQEHARDRDHRHEWSRYQVGQFAVSASGPARHCVR